MRRFMLITILLSASLAACSWVKVTPAGEKVRVFTSKDVGHCRLLGRTTSSGVDKILAAKRIDDVVSRELTDMARNSAVELGGDTIVPVTPIVDGKQSFAVYKCL